ncbi:MAG: hypothetical protein A2W99_16820 [Bacteroidetes bacterium GWF2_33_16]|nr:MAG: hypothetical protein A2X00_13975 [Bacteroidetes bacterium GWE2_32_14]OFY03411.1 MAG: hypothetical protein A2W99_16820 [Bacteroidetes bacterium GWF2_33_16]
MENKKPHIAVIGLKGLPAFGGAATVGENLIDQLKNDYNFTVYSLSTHTKGESIDGIKQIVFNGCKNTTINTFLYYIKSLFHCLFFAKYDLIHLHHAESGFITPLLRLKYKVVVTFHGVFFDKSDPKFGYSANKFFRWSEKLNIKYASIVISVSKTDANNCNLKYNTNIQYIPNGITIQNIGKNVFIESYMVFAASRIYEIKGLHLLLEAIRNNRVNQKLFIIGDLNHVPAYKKKIELLARGLNVTFIGLIKNKQELFKIINDANLFIFPSLFEAMSMMLLEVVSLKTPVLASKIPANTEIFNDQEMLFFELEKENELQKKLSFALTNPEEMKIKAEKAFQKLNEKYTWEIISLKYNSIYKNLISN